VSRRPEDLARRYVGWIRRHSLAIIAAHVVMVVGAVYLIANHLPLYADFSYLLPQDAPAVRDLRRLEARIEPSDTLLALVEAPDPTTRAAAAKELADELRKAPHDLIERVDDDDTDVRAFFRANRHLFVPLDDLRLARDTLARYIKRAKLKANPLYIDLDDPDPQADAKVDKQLDELQARRKSAEARLERSSHVSADGTIGLLQIRAPFRQTDAGRGRRLVDAFDAARDVVVAHHPTVRIGFTGGVVTAVAEHDAIFKGMVMSSLITGLLVGLVLALYFRSATLLGLLIGTLSAATVIAFGFAAITVGHLNAATAFLGAIIAGNGVNYGILLIARYLEERGRQHGSDGHANFEKALATAIVGTLRPTAVASLGASIAYGSLAATSFKGFADFAVIGAIGMIVCWLASYLLLPALIVVLGRNTRIYSGDPIVGSTLVRVIGFRRSGVVCVVAMIVATLAGVVVYRYIAADPFEYDIKQLRSEGDDAVESRSWMELSDKTFGRGISNRTYIAADRADQVPKIIAALRDHDRGLPPDRQTFGAIYSILDFVPPDQQAKLALLAEIRHLLDDPILDGLDDKERANLRGLRPPDHLRPITGNSLPMSLRQPMTERDGRMGFLIAIRPAESLDEWNGKDLIRFADAVREIHLADGETVTTSGASVIFADIVDSIERDGPRVTAVAGAGLLIMVLLLVGPNRRAFAVLAGTTGGSVLMVAICAIAGLRVNFLDFVALPITLGLGIDYAINVAHRQTTEAFPDPITTLRTSGSAVFVCSLTTIIGYGSLLISDNLAIRGFGTASLIGEIACVFTALVVVPAILAVGRKG